MKPFILIKLDQETVKGKSLNLQQMKFLFSSVKIDYYYSSKMCVGPLKADQEALSQEIGWRK